MPIPAYRAKQSTNTTGTGTIVLAAAETNARNFSAAYGASSRRVMYAISWSTGFEIGLGDFDGGTPGNLTRATVLASSNAGALVTLPAGTKDVFAVFDPAAREVVSISATATLALADLGNAVVFTGASAATLNLPAVATAPTGSGWMVRNAGTAALTIDPSGAETINGASTLVLQAGQAAFIFDGGAAWECIIAGGTAIGAALLAALNSAAVADLASGAPLDIASAATTDIGASASPNVRITGTTGITSFGTVAAGTRRFLAFAAALTLTHNATSLILPGAANITTAAGDNAVARSLGSGNWVIESFTRAAAGYAGNILLANPVAAANIGINRGTEQATSAGTQVQYDFGSIPAGVRRVKLLLKQVSTNGTSHLAVRLGTSGGIVSSGYDCMFSYDAPGVAGVTSVGTGAFGISNGSSVDTHTGIMTFENQSGNLWLCSYIGMMAVNADRYRNHCAGFVDLGAVLTQLRLTTNSGTPVFDAGAIQLKWEF